MPIPEKLVSGTAIGSESANMRYFFNTPMRLDRSASLAPKLLWWTHNRPYSGATKDDGEIAALEEDESTAPRRLTATTSTAEFAELHTAPREETRGEGTPPPVPSTRNHPLQTEYKVYWTELETLSNPASALWKYGEKVSWNTPEVLRTHLRRTN
uniref:Tudor domain-containing protein 12 n=1 Tax=Lygus hesperus TaxID=30085 RepID=A0A0A9WEN1_LYGHE